MSIYKRMEVPFENAKEVREFENFLYQTGRKRGPWVRRLILEAMHAEGSQQGRQLAAAMKGGKE